jgi:hypothetical protein
MFEDLETEQWLINSQNIIEFIEALQLDRFLTEDEANRLVETSSISKDGNGKPEVEFIKLVGPLTELLLQEKNIEFDQLLNTHCTVPVDRIQKFLTMLQKELDQKKFEGEKLNVVE